MGKYNGAVITAAGQNVIAQAITGTELTWTVMRTSSVAVPQGTDLTTLTSLSGIEQTSNITDASVYGNNVIQLSSRFSNTGIATVYYIQTVGIYGQLAGGAETLIAVMTAVTPDEMPVYDPDSPSAFIFNTQITVQNANEVTMTVNDTGTATVADLNRKVDINGGNISNTVITTITTSPASYPTVAAGDTLGVAVGKVNKSIGDIIANKLDKNGDAANATIGSSVASSASYPVPAAGDSFKTILGKIIKFSADIVKTFTGATSSAAGAKGLVPAPSSVQRTAYLRGDGTWVQPQNNATTTAEGLNLDARMGKTLNDAIEATPDLEWKSILNQASQITISALATLPLGVYIVQVATPPSDFPTNNSYGLLYHYGSLVNYHHLIFTNAAGIYKITFSGSTSNGWKTYLPILTMDLSINYVNSNAFDIGAATNYVVGYTSFLNGYLIGSNGSNYIVTFFTNESVLNCRIRDLNGMEARSGTYTLRLRYTA